MLRQPMREARELNVLVKQGLIDRILVSVPSRKRYLERIGLECDVVPVGYTSWYGHLKTTTENVRDIDVLFLGVMSARRKKMLKKHFRTTKCPRLQYRCH